MNVALSLNSVVSYLGESLRESYFIKSFFKVIKAQVVTPTLFIFQARFARG